MAYYDENGTITIDEQAANADIRRIETAVSRLEESRKALTDLTHQAADGQGQTMAAVTEKAAELNGKIAEMLSRLHETEDFIRRTVSHYQQIDASLRAQIMGGTGNG